jgi:hypothetical protein
MTETPLFRSRAGLVAMVFAGALLVAGLVQSASQPTPTDGPAGSSFATHGEGTAALVDLLEANGYNVVRERRALAEVPPPPGDTIVVVNGSDLSSEDEAALSTHAAAGGRIILVGSTRLDFILDRSPTEFERTEEPARALLPVDGFGELTGVDARWVWRNAGSLVPVVGNSQGTLAGVESVADGTVVALADTSVIANAGLANADNALLAVRAIGEPTATVRFVEYIHGFTQPTGLAALPTRWKQALLVLALAGAVWLLARSRRFGPPEAASRSLAPPRSAYVDAVAATLDSSRDAAASAPLDEALSNRLTQQGMESPSATTMIETAVRAGADPAVAERALTGATDDGTLRAKAILLSQIINKEQL